MLTTAEKGGPVLHGPVRGGFNYLIPTAYDDVWTAMNDGVFNEYPWHDAASGGFANNNRSATIPITSTTASNLALVALNQKRISILMQNNSTAISPDVAPYFWFNFGAIAVAGFGIGLAPGVGIVLDQNVQADALYVTIGTYTNTGGTVVIQGAVLETSDTG
jgi:hypothetical protein